MSWLIENFKPFLLELTIAAIHTAIIKISSNLDTFVSPAVRRE